MVRKHGCLESVCQFICLPYPRRSHGLSHVIVSLCLLFILFEVMVELAQKLVAIHRHSQLNATLENPYLDCASPEIGRKSSSLVAFFVDRQEVGNVVPSRTHRWWSHWTRDDDKIERKGECKKLHLRPSSRWGGKAPAENLRATVQMLPALRSPGPQSTQGPILTLNILCSSYYCNDLFL